MPRPPAVPTDMLVDAGGCARAGSTIERHFSLADLPRLHDAGARKGSAIDARLKFSLFDDRPVVEGTLRGAVVLTCQRCMNAVPVALDEAFRVVVVAQERADEPGGYEPVIANAARLDLRWLTEEQALLALPLVPMHEDEQCNVAAPQPKGGEEHEGIGQKPFQNLRDMLRQR